MKVGKMRLIIDEIRYEGNKIVVKGKTAIGEMKGVWKYTEPPVLGKGYHLYLLIMNLLYSRVSVRGLIMRYTICVLMWTG